MTYNYNLSFAWFEEKTNQFVFHNVATYRSKEAALKGLSESLKDADEGSIEELDPFVSGLILVEFTKNGDKKRLCLRKDRVTLSKYYPEDTKPFETRFLQYEF